MKIAKVTPVLPGGDPLCSRLEPVHHEKTARDRTPGGLGLTSLFSIAIGRVPHVFVEQAAEGTKALKTDFKADVGNAQLLRAEQLFGFLNPSLNQILMRGLPECLSKESQKLVTRKTGLRRYLIQIERTVVTVVYKLARAA